MSQGGSAILGSGSQSCQVMAKTDNAQSIVNILSAIHLKRDIVREALPFHPDAMGASTGAARQPLSCPPPGVRLPIRCACAFAQARTASHSAAPLMRTAAPSAAPKAAPAVLLTSHVVDV